MVWTWAFIIQNIFFGIVIPVLLYYGLPRIDFYMKNRSLSARQRKIEELKNQYSIRKLLHETPTLLTSFALREFVKDIRKVILGIGVVLAIYWILINVFYPETLTKPAGRILYGIVFLFNIVYITYTGFSSTYHVLTDSFSFSKYKIRTEKKMKKLGGNPEDLDKEEAE